jgi:leucyl/phenylalanyl-tRNA--protein transferase
MIARPHKIITPELVLNAYREGFFPMADDRGEIKFCAYDPRGVIPLDERFRVRRSLRQAIEKNNYHITFDAAPLEVLRGCARFDENLPTGERWLSAEMIEIYLKLFEMGTMHTVEIWTSGQDADSAPPSSFIPHPSSFPKLSGGLYGLTFGAAFCGESMFSRAPFASQIALVYLVERLRMKGFKLLDAQMPSEHLQQFGLYECSQGEYLTLFHAAAEMDVKW